MNCRESRQLIPAYVDNELTPKDAERLAVHFRACGACARQAEEEARFVAGLRLHRSEESLPPALRQQLLQSLRQGRPAAPVPARSWRPLVTWLGPALAACALLLVLMQRPAQADWSRVFFQEHQQSVQTLPLDFPSQSRTALGDWFQHSLSHKVHVPAMKGAQLLGGTIAHVQGKPVSLALYHVDGEVLSFYAGDESALCPRGWSLPENQIYLQESQGLSLAAWSHGDHLHVAVARLTPDRLRILALQCQASVL